MAIGVSCPDCGSTESNVLDSRPVLEPVPATRRRRRCAAGHRFTTFELVEDTRFGSLLDISALPDHLRKPFRSLFWAFMREAGGGR